ncbi:helix-turn-helix domain-containing protein [Actinoplanes sp. NPDC020271]|uniref:helix-turn-helix domain-containing protein n=1 Tax=Actinoplanes sp. NPDC020271 TaxID=3363896 RepID=UPI0037953B68
MAEVFETHDLDEAVAELERGYGRLRLRATGDDHYLRIAHVGLGPIWIDGFTFRMRFSADLAPMNLVAVGRVLSGGVTRETGSDVLTSGPGDLLMAVQPGRAGRATADNPLGEQVCFLPELLAEVADPAPGRAPRPIRFTGRRPISARSAVVWQHTFDYIRDNIAGQPAAGEPLIVGAAARMLAAVTLSTFPSTTGDDPTIEDRHDAHPAALRRALTFIDENAHRDISPADIALAARVTIRSLQLAFRRHLGTTPTTHLRRVRLDHAHRQLLAADPAGTTVSAIAMRWGFASHSSFTASYRDVYGVLPSTTLRRR